MTDLCLYTYLPVFSFWRTWNAGFVLVLCPLASHADHTLIYSWGGSILRHWPCGQYQVEPILTSVWVFWFLFSSLASSPVFVISYLVVTISLNVPIKYILEHNSHCEVWKQGHNYGVWKWSFGGDKVRQGLQAKRSFSDEIATLIYEYIDKIFIQKAFWYYANEAK